MAGRHICKHKELRDHTTELVRAKGLNPRTRWRVVGTCCRCGRRVTRFQELAQA